MNEFKRITENNDNTQTPIFGGESSLERTVLEQTVTYEEKTESDYLYIPSDNDPSYTMDEQEITEMSSFLSRPVRIFNFQWNAGGLTPMTIKPWFLFLNNDYVKNKIANFAFISFTLCIKILINSTQFNFGNLKLLYHPLTNMSPDTLGDVTAVDKVAKSQRMHVTILPQTNTDGEMKLPFFFLKNFLTLSDSEEINNMGTIDIIEYVELDSASNDVATPVDIQILAHAENLCLTGATIEGVLQGSEADEFAVEPVSKPATAVANIASMFTSVPFIAPFAKATQIGAQATSSIAKLFGYTKVPVIESSKPYKSLPYNGISSAEISEPKDKFTLDPKAELTLDPRTVGLTGEDEMSINKIICRESFLTNFVWRVADEQDTLLFNMNINPSIRMTENLSEGVLIGYTPMSHIAQLFNNWRGDIEVRFHFICSSLHKGRVRVTWDPCGDLVANSNTYNTSLTAMLNLDECSDVRLRIPYQQARPWQQTRSVFPGDRAHDWQTSNFTNLVQKDVGNGTLTVRVLNKLNVISADADISVMVYIRAADNLELANPINVSNDYSHFELQGSPVQTKELSLGETGKVSDNRYLINWGESVSSLRTLCRRSTLSEVVPLEPLSDGNNSAYVIVSHYMNKFPVAPGFNPDVDTRASTGIFTSEPYAFTHMTPINWILPAYVGCRGSLQWTFNVNANGSSPVESVSLTRTLDQIPSPSLFENSSGNGLNSNEYYNFFNEQTINGNTGVVITNQRTQAGLSTELNMFNANRFVSSSNFRTTKGDPFDNSDRETYKLQLVFANQGRNDIAGTLIQKFVCLGPDFNLFYYLNAPPTTFRTVPVTPN